jgi:hypothetical protein
MIYLPIEIWFIVINFLDYDSFIRFRIAWSYLAKYTNNIFFAESFVKNIKKYCLDGIIVNPKINCLYAESAIYSIENFMLLFHFKSYKYDILVKINPSFNFILPIFYSHCKEYGFEFHNKRGRHFSPHKIIFAKREQKKICDFDYEKYKLSEKKVLKTKINFNQFDAIFLYGTNIYCDFYVKKNNSSNVIVDNLRRCNIILSHTQDIGYIKTNDTTSYMIRFPFYEIDLSDGTEIQITENEKYLPNLSSFDVIKINISKWKGNNIAILLVLFKKIMTSIANYGKRKHKIIFEIDSGNYSKKKSFNHEIFELFFVFVKCYLRQLIIPIDNKRKLKLNCSLKSFPIGADIKQKISLMILPSSNIKFDKDFTRVVFI